MSRTSKIILSICVALVAALGASASASAAIRFEIRQSTNGDAYYQEVYGLDEAQQSTMRHVRAGVELDRNNYAPGNSYNDVYGAVQAGDVLEIYQYPAGDPVLPPIPLVPPARSVVVPNFTLNPVAGSNTISGAASDEWSTWVGSYSDCTSDRLTLPATRGPGTYSATFPFAVSGQSYASVMGKLPSGDVFRLEGRTPGDANCIEIDASKGTSTSTHPYEVDIDGIDWNVAPTIRVRLMRGGALVAESTDDEVDLTEAQKPLAGDVVEVYRPEDAPSPTLLYTVPAVSGVVDIGNDLTATDAPAGSYLDARVCRPVTCDESDDNWRSIADFPAGRTLLDFASPLGGSRAYNIFAGDPVLGSWYSPDGRVEVEFDFAEGDLTNPIGTVKLASKLKAKSLGKKVKFKLTSSEAGNMSAKLTLDPAKKSSKSKKKPAKPLTLASGKSAVAAGSNTLSLKTSKSGKKALKKIAKGKKSVRATLTLTLVDASGNATTVVKSTKLK